jgi:hypothetical protein
VRVICTQLRWERSLGKPETIELEDGVPRVSHKVGDGRLPCGRGLVVARTVLHVGIIADNDLLRVVGAW